MWITLRGVMTLARDPYVEHLETSVVEAGPQQAVVEQPDAPPLSNHVGVRHASALHAAGYEAARALVGKRAGSARAELVRSEIAYERPGMGPLTFTAEPEGDDWAGLTEVAVKVAGVDENGKRVAALTTVWKIS